MAVFAFHPSPGNIYPGFITLNGRFVTLCFCTVVRRYNFTPIKHQRHETDTPHCCNLFGHACQLRQPPRNFKAQHIQCNPARPIHFTGFLNAMWLLLICQGMLLLYSLSVTFGGDNLHRNKQTLSLTERLQECAVNSLLLGLPIIGFTFHIQWLMGATLLLYPALLLTEFLAHWRPYLQQRAGRLHSGPLPPDDNSSDAAITTFPHLSICIMHGLILANAVCAYIYFFSA